MAAKKGGLGKGLDSLITNKVGISIAEKEKKAEADKDIVFIRTSKIEPNRNQPRKNFNEDALLELSESIKQYGVLQPLLVQDKKEYYEIIAGERRWRAAKIAGLLEIPVIIKKLNDKEMVEISLIENIQREDLNPIEKARGIKQLMDEYNLTQQKVAEKLGKSRSSIANTVRILNLDERVINLALEGKLTEGHCKSLMAIDDSERQYKMAQYIIESGDSVREAEKKMKVRKKVSKKNDKYIPIYRDIENTFQGFFGTKVKLDAGERKGKIIIQYSSNDDLERILGLIK